VVREEGWGKKEKKELLSNCNYYIHLYADYKFPYVSPSSLYLNES
jgi:hypothetical protein